MYYSPRTKLLIILCSSVTSQQCQYRQDLKLFLLQTEKEAVKNAWWCAMLE